ncbi:MAG: RipA family octameric membrane protein [Candidatus Heimdallarchaeota archaeon]
MAKITKSEPEPDPTETSNPIDNIFNTIDRSPTEIRYTFEQYRLYVQMADKVSARRATTNSFFLTANSFLFVAMGALFGNSQLFIFVPIILIVGIFFSISWMQLIKHYKALNGCKYRVINAIEANLYVNGFITEWKLWKEQEGSKKGRRLTNIELWIPMSLIILYSLGLILMIVIISLNPELITGTITPT